MDHDKTRCFLWLSGFFGTLTVGHLIRVIFQWRVVVNQTEVPLKVSVIILCIAAVLSFFFWKKSCKCV